MNQHVATSEIERFSVSALPDTELDDIARHLAACSSCHQNLAAALRRQKDSAPTSFVLAPEFWLRHDHVDYDQLVQIADDQLDATDREIIDIHLRVCPACREDVRSFLAFREEMKSEGGEASHAPVPQVPPRERYSLWEWSRGVVRKPIYAIPFVVLLGVALVISAVLLKRRTTILHSLPASEIANGPARSARPTPAVNNPADTAAVVSLIDERGGISVDKSGRITGLDAVPPAARKEIAEVLLRNRIERPGILQDLAGNNSTLRGTNKGKSFNLIYPARRVIVEDRPQFKWEQLSGAASYRVYVSDSNAREVARSEYLQPANTEWRSPPLKRGEIYTWVVVGVVDGKEIVSPGPAQPEVRFHILPSSGDKELLLLKRARSHLALGVFYSKVGMIAEAEREFQQLGRLNPGSRIATNLLHRVRALRTED